VIRLLLAVLHVGISDPCDPNEPNGTNNHFAASVIQAGDVPVPLKGTYDCDQIREQLRGVDYVIFTGGEDLGPHWYGERPKPTLGKVNAFRDGCDFALFNTCLREKKPMLGICRGMQILNVFFGGTLYCDIPSEYAPDGGRARACHNADWEKRQTMPPLHSVVFAKGSRLAEAFGAEKLSVNSFHHQGVRDLAPGMVATGRAEDGFVEAVEYSGFPMMGVQFHPEVVAAQKPKGFDVERFVDFFRRIGPIVSDTKRLAPPTVTRAFRVPAERPYLMVPCSGCPSECRTFAREIGYGRMDLSADGTNVLTLTVDAPYPAAAGWESPIDLSAYAGRELVFTLNAQGQFGLDPFVRFRFASADELPKDVYAESYRPQFHFTPKYGWSNDPNGLSYYNGQWHIFYQSVACSTLWRPSNAWRHAVSDDLLHWRELKPAIEADEQAAAWSGSAVTCGDRHVLAYTRRSWTGESEQALAESANGVDYVKCGAVLPQRTPGNRDPFVFWHQPTQAWIQTLFIETNEVQTLEILSSKDLKSWRHESYVEGDRYDAPGDPPRKFLHECPILVEVPIESTKERRWLIAGGSMAYRIGRFDGHVFTPETEVVTPFPQRIGPAGRNAYYKPYYAGQAFNGAPDGRVIYMPWYKLETPKGALFSQGLGLPLEFTLVRTPEGLRLRFLPVKELERLRQGDAVPLEAFRGELAEVEYAATVGTDARIALDLRGVHLVYDAAKGTLSVGDEVSVPWKVENGRFAIRAYVDRLGLEVFSQDGFQVLPDPTARPNSQVWLLSCHKEGVVSSESARAWHLTSVYYPSSF